MVFETAVGTKVFYAVYYTRKQHEEEDEPFTVYAVYSYAADAQAAIDKVKKIEKRNDLAIKPVRLIPI